jgi:ethanolamine ammonia-lyase large subunit
MVAAVSKLMRNQDLIAVARKASVITGFRTTIGLPGRLSTRLQPNHPPTIRAASPRPCSTGCCMAWAMR